MFKLNNYPLLFQLILLNVIGQNLTYCAAKIQAKQTATPLDLELITAAAKGNKEKVEELIGSGANVNAANPLGSTALIKAVFNGNKEIVELLIRAHANVNAKNLFNNTALMGAAGEGFKEIVEILLKSGVDIDNFSPSNVTRNSYPEIVAMINNEKSRREAVIKKWIKEILAKKITESTSGVLIPDIAQITAEYTENTEYIDLPLEYRLNN